jgi:hypothetical protein
LPPPAVLQTRSTFPAHPQISSSSSICGRDLRISLPHAKLEQAEVEVTRDFQWESWPWPHQPAFGIAKGGPGRQRVAVREPRPCSTPSISFASAGSASWNASEVATAEIRVGALEDTVNDARRLVDLQLERQKRGEIAGLEWTPPCSRRRAARRPEPAVGPI